MKLLESIAWKANANKRGLMTTTSVGSTSISTGSDPYANENGNKNLEISEGNNNNVSKDKYEVATDQVISETNSGSMINIESFDFRSMWRNITQRNDIENKFPTIGTYRYMSDFARMLTETKQEVTPMDMVKILMFFPKIN